jgi:hypothetical protein
VVISITLLKAYLIGSNDPFVLAKVYYDDLILKDVASVERVINETLTFDMEKDLKRWSTEIKELQEEYKFWEDMYNKLKPQGELQSYLSDLYEDVPEVTPAEREMPVRVYGEKGWEKGTETETVLFKELPAYLKGIRSDIDVAAEVIEDFIEERNSVIEEITNMPAASWEMRGEWDNETYIRIHKLGLSYIEDKLEYYQDAFQRLKDNKEIPQIRPDRLDDIDNDVKELANKWKEMGQSKKPVLAERSKKVDQLTEVFENYDDEWRWNYYEKAIQAWTTSKTRSEKELDKYLKGKSKELGIGELKRLGKEHGLKYSADKDVFWKRIKPRKERGVTLPPKHEWEKEYYEYNEKTNSFVKVEEPVKEEKDAKRVTINFTDESWWEMLVNTSQNVYSNDKAKIDGKKITKKSFLSALKGFFKRAPSQFNTPPKTHKTNTGIGMYEYGKGGTAKLIPESPTVRLGNLKTLLNLFDSLPDKEKGKHSVRLIITAIQAEIGYEEEELKRGLKGKLSNEAKGKQITNKLAKHLESAYNKTRYYTEGEFPVKFLNDISEIKKTGLKLRELRIFAKGQVIIQSELDSEDKGTSQRTQYLLNTFNRSESNFKKVVEWLNKNMKEGKILLDLIADAWDDKSVYKPSIGTSDEEKLALNRMMDKYLGLVIEELDAQEDIIATYDGYADDEIEQIIIDMKEVLEQIESTQGQEMWDGLFKWFEEIIKNFQDTVSGALSKLSPLSEDYKKLDGIKNAILDELEQIPELSELIEIDTVSQPTTPYKIIQSRKAKADDIKELIHELKDKQIEGNPYAWINDYMERAPTGSLDKFGNVSRMSETKQRLLRFVDSRLPIAETAKGKTKRISTIHKIIDDKPITTKDVDWDLKETKARRIWGRGKQPRRKYSEKGPETGGTQEHEEYDETSVGERETTEMAEGQEELDMTSRGLDYVDEFEEKPKEQEEDDDSPW